MISVIIPTYNREKTLPDAMKSVLDQSITDIELIIADDCSTDGTEKLVKEMADPRVRYVRLPGNQGACAARNAGIDAARGVIIAFQDSDDKWLPGKLERQLAVLKETGADVCFHSLKKIYTDSGKVEDFPRIAGSRFMSHQEMCNEVVISTQTIMGVRKAFQVRFDPAVKKAQDYDWGIRASREFSFYFLKEALAEQYVHNDSITAQGWRSVKESREYFLQKYKDEFPENPGFELLQLRKLAKSRVIIGEDASKEYRRIYQITHNRQDLAKILLYRTGFMKLLYKMRGIQEENTISEKKQMKYIKKQKPRWVVEIEYKTLGYALLLFALYTPKYIASFGGSLLNRGLWLFTLAGYAYTVYTWINRRNVSYFLIITLLMYGAVVTGTFLNHGSIYDSIWYTFCSVVIVMMADNESENIDCLWKACIYYFGIVLFINFLTLIMYPDGMFKLYVSYGNNLIEGQANWFYSSQNGMGKPMLFLIYFKADSDLRRYRHLTGSFYLLSAMCIVSLVLVDSSTSLTTVAVLAGVMMLANLIRRLRFRLFNIYVVLGIIAVLFVLFVIVQQAGIFSYFIEDVLEEDLTFHGRAFFWTKTLALIARKPVFGYGLLSARQFRALLADEAASDAHNYFLTMGMQGGMVCMAFLVLILLFTAYYIHKKQYEYSGITATAFLFCFLLMLLFENTGIRLYWMIFAYSCYMGAQEENVSTTESHKKARSKWIKSQA